MLGVKEGTLTYKLDLKFAEGPHPAGGVDLMFEKCADYILRLLRAVGVTSWEKLRYRYIRVRRAPDGKITAIGHIIDDRWFDIVEE